MRVLIALWLLAAPASASDAFEVLLQSRSVARDLSGTFWVYHGVSGIERERSAAGVTALRPDGSRRTYLASEILPPGSVLSGTVGQVFAVTPLSTRGFYAATAGWRDPERRVHTAIVFFRERANGSIVNHSVIPATARAIAAGPDDTIIVAAVDLLKDGELTLATILDAKGNVLGSFGPFTANSRMAATTRISDVRFHQLDPSNVAILDGTEERVHGVCMQLRSSATDVMDVAPLWSVSIAKTDVAATETMPVMGFSATIGGVVTVARGAVIDDEPRTLVTRYDKVPRSWTSKHFWRAALVDDSTVRGIVSADTVWEERVELPRTK